MAISKGSRIVLIIIQCLLPSWSTYGCSNPQGAARCVFHNHLSRCYETGSRRIVEGFPPFAKTDAALCWWIITWRSKQWLVRDTKLWNTVWRLAEPENELYYTADTTLLLKPPQWRLFFQVLVNMTLFPLCSHWPDMANNTGVATVGYPLIEVLVVRSTELCWSPPLATTVSARLD